MKILPFNVDGQVLTKADTESFENIVAGSDNYLCCKFNFDDSWDKYSKIIEISNRIDTQFYNVIDSKFVIPGVATDGPYIKIRLNAVEDHNVVFATNWVLIEQRT